MKFEKLFENIINESSIALLDEFKNLGRNFSDRHNFRYKLCSKYSFAIPDEGALNIIAKYGPILELGAGTGYWASLLKDRGVDIIATNPPGFTLKNKQHYNFNENYINTELIDNDSALEKYPDRNLFLCWPSYDEDWAYKALLNFKGDYLIYIGEDQGGCTADDDFFKELHSNWIGIRYYDIPQWPGIHDGLRILKRNKEIGDRQNYLNRPLRYMFET